MSVYRVLDKLESYVHEGTWLPWGYRVLSGERLSEYIEKIRASLPEEVGRAKLIAKDKERVIRAAQEQAQAIVSEASSAQQRAVEESDVVERARTTAETVLRDAEERAQKIRDGADKYAAQVLADLEIRLASALGSVKKGRQTLQAPKAPSPSLADAAARNKRAAFDAADETVALKPVEI